MQNTCEDTYVFAVQSNPVWGAQPIDEDSEEGLVVDICDAHELGVLLYAHVHGIVPAHVARHKPVVFAPVLDVPMRGEVIGVGRRFGCI